jgi:hypothetical protein
MVAGGRLPLEKRDWRAASCEIAKALLRKLGRTGTKSRWLIDRPDGASTNRSAASQLLEELPLDRVPVQSTG